VCEEPSKFSKKHREPLHHLCIFNHSVVSKILDEFITRNDQSVFMAQSLERTWAHDGCDTKEPITITVVSQKLRGAIRSTSTTILLLLMPGT
jgi:hypothetical protein